ncbi:MoaD/ThiS family protein [Wohlfahrtiimonas larvae]|uniref:Molybdopterin converting factor subunit 1 n=1 Tax=Wohlfahrtiimonas larvae TaxID=1157986 RepID=A0ABP9MEN3_9GAMM|nr:MoaD/ThiS family protein [Wohlfahrtiimonas larvae]
MITIQYFGVLKDRVGLAQEEIAWESGDTEKLLTELRARDDIWSDALAPERVFRIVLNDEILYEVAPVKKGDRVAILPPVTGG